MESTTRIELLPATNAMETFVTEKIGGRSIVEVDDSMSLIAKLMLS